MKRFDGKIIEIEIDKGEQVKFIRNFGLLVIIRGKMEKKLGWSIPARGGLNRHSLSHSHKHIGHGFGILYGLVLPSWAGAYQ